MTSIPPTIAAETAIARQNVVLSGVKQNAEQEQQFASMIEDVAKSAPVNQSRGSNLDIKV